MNKITVLYGSQTGTAQEMAEGLWRRLRYCGFVGPVLAMDDYRIGDLIKERFVVFVCSTTGVGEEPDNMKAFWKFLLRKNLPTDSLRNLKFAVLGLGDSTYSKFNYPAKKLNKRLSQLGGNQLLDVGLCDYQHDLGHDSVAEPWTERLWTSLKSFFPYLNLTEYKSAPLMYMPRWKIERLNGSSHDFAISESLYFCNDIEKSFFMELKCNTRTTTPKHFQDVRLLEFTPINSHFNDYAPGDVLYLRPRNSNEMVERFFRIFENHELKLKPDNIMYVSQIYDDMAIPKIFTKPMKLHQIVEQYWDLSSIPKKYVFSVLGYLSEDELEKNKCIEFCSAEGQEELFNYVNRPRRHILEVLEDFRHSTSKLTIESLFEIFTCIKPRAFSIASSCKAAHNKQIDLLVAVVKYYTKLKAERLGLCSNWLKNLVPGEKIIGWIKKGTFIFPNDEITPIIMIGPGTGLAPFRNFIMEREFLRKASKDLLILFFGCRNKSGDFHCGEYLKMLELNGKLHLICAFSRDQERKVYVQHKIKENKYLFWNWLHEKNASIFIAGNSKDMPTGVKDAILENVLMEEGVMEKNNGEEYLKNMEISGRLQMETW